MVDLDISLYIKSQNVNSCLSRDTLTSPKKNKYIFDDDSLCPRYDDSHVSNVIILNLKWN